MPGTRTSTVSHSVPFWEPGSLHVKRKLIIYFHIFWTTGCIWGVRLLTSSFHPVFHPQFTAPFPLQSASTALSPENCFWKLARKLGRYSTYFLNKYSVFSHLKIQTSLALNIMECNIWIFSRKWDWVGGFQTFERISILPCLVQLVLTMEGWGFNSSQNDMKISYLSWVNEFWEDLNENT